MITKSEKMPESLIKSLSYQTLDGLAHIHKQGFFHRDMKPENILISDKNVVKIADFGLAKEIRSLPPLTDYVSTRWYRAPELLLKAEIYNSKVDIFALGCIIVEMYLLAPLFAGENEMDQLNKIISILGTPPLEWTSGQKLAKSLGIKFKESEKVSLRSIVPNASSNGIDLLEKMLLYDPIKRISAQEALKHPYFTESLKTAHLGSTMLGISQELEIKNNSDFFDKKFEKSWKGKEEPRTDLGAFDKDDSFGILTSPKNTKKPTQVPPLKPSTNRILDELEDYDFGIKPSPNNGPSVTKQKVTPMVVQNNVKKMNKVDDMDDMDFIFDIPPSKPSKAQDKSKSIAFDIKPKKTSLTNRQGLGRGPGEYSVAENFSKKERDKAFIDDFDDVLESQFKSSKPGPGSFSSRTQPVNSLSLAALKPSPTQKPKATATATTSKPLEDDWEDEFQNPQPSRRGFLY